jgi:hypothetical protein
VDGDGRVVWSWADLRAESATVGGSTLARAADGTLVTPDHLCPDLLRYANLGGADGVRGRVVRGFFWLLRAWPVRG